MDTIAQITITTIHIGTIIMEEKIMVTLITIIQTTKDIIIKEVVN